MAMLTEWQANGLTTAEGLKPFSIQSNRPIAVDASKQLVVGETEPTNPVAVAKLLGELGGPTTDAPDILVGPPTVNGTAIAQQIDGSAMIVDRIYEIIFTHGPSNNRRTFNQALWAVE